MTTLRKAENKGTEISCFIVESLGNKVHLFVVCSTTLSQ
jgi:hypothetical protein